MKRIIDNTKIVIFLITLGLFGLSYFVGIATVIIQTLSFLILLEIVRTIYDYIIKPEHRVKIRYIIDGGILFGMRELFVGWVMLKSGELSALIVMGYVVPMAVIGLSIMIISGLTIGALIFYRYKVIISSPDQLEVCETSELSKNKV